MNPYPPLLTPLLTLFCCLLFAQGQSLEGVLSMQSGQLRSGEYFNSYPYSAQRGEALHISLTSSDFDPYLMVLDEGGRVLLEVDDSPGFALNVDTRVLFPQAGLYSIVVTSALSDEMGRYRLVLRSETAEAAFNATPMASFAAPEPMQGRVTDSEGAGVGGVEMGISGNTAAGAVIRFETTTDEEGFYQLTLPQGLHDLQAYVQVPTDLGTRLNEERVKGAAYSLELRTTRLLRPDLLPPGSSLELTLSPQDPDGGATLSYRQPLNAAEFSLRGLHEGLYHLSATLILPRGERQVLRLGTSEATLSERLELRLEDEAVLTLLVSP